MATRFDDRISVQTKTGARTITLKFKSKEISGPRIVDLATSVKDMHEQAKNWLAVAISRLNPPLERAVTAWANKFFLTDSDRLSGAHLIIIKRHLELILGGLSSDWTLKTGEVVTRREKDGDGDDKGRITEGQVVEKRDKKKGYIHDTEGHQLKPGRNYVWNYGRDKWSGPMIAQSIKLRLEIVENPILGPRVLVHEASHKYAGTRDFALIEIQNGGESIILNLQEIATIPPDVNELLHNADSYALFVNALGARW